MRPHVAGTNQSGLQQKENQPSREYRRMDIQNSWPRNRRVDQVPANRKTEPEHHGRRNQQRQARVKIVLQKAATPLGSDALHRRNRNAHIRGAHNSPLLLWSELPVRRPILGRHLTTTPPNRFPESPLARAPPPYQARRLPEQPVWR